MEQSAVAILQKFYSGFLISRPVGNNAFHFEERVNKSIYVPPICAGSLDDLAVGYHIAFSEVDEGKEFNELGLAKFVYFKRDDIPVFIFDNHNHAFFFWLFGIWHNDLPKGLSLVHVDQHSDMWKPDPFPTFSLNSSYLLNKAFHYTNFVLNVGNFIKPALHLKFFSDVSIITGSFDFKLKFKEPIVFDLDMDFFAPEMDYIDNAYKIKHIRNLLKKAKFVTVAISPFFMDQEFAIRILKRIFEY